MNLQHVRYFLAVMDTGSISRAAEALGVTQPTLSVALKRLEVEFATRLFVPDGRGIRPLPEARLLEQKLRPVVRALADAKRELKGGPTPRVRVGILQSLAGSWLSRLVGACDGQVEIVEGLPGELEKRLTEGSVDVALTALPLKARFASKPLFREPYALFVGGAHVFAGRRTVSLAELDRQPFILRQCCESLGTGRQLMEAAGVRLNVVAKTRQEATAAALVAAGIGCTIAPRSWGRPGSEAVSITGFALERSVGLAWRAKGNTVLARRIAKTLEGLTAAPGQVALRTSA